MIARQRARLRTGFTACLLASVSLLLGACSRGESNVALGTLERDRVVLTATASEIITAQPIAEGSHIEAGQLLVQLDSRMQSLTVERVEAELAEREAALELLRNGNRSEEITAAQARVDMISATLRDNQLQLARIENLLTQGVATQAELDSASALFESNQARLRDAEAQLQLLRVGTRPEEIAQAEARLRASKAQLELEQRRLADLSITATRDGTLDSLPFHVGERVSLGAQMAIILDDAPPYARIYVPEPKRADIAPGTMLTVHVDGSEDSFAGEVRWIAREPAFTPYYALNSSERSRLVYMAEVQLPETAVDLPAGIPVQVDLPE